MRRAPTAHGARAGLVLAIAACGPTARPANPAPGAEPAADAAPHRHDSSAPCTAQLPADANQARRSELIAEIARVDRELDAIDLELVTEAQLGGLTLDEARALAITSSAVLGKTSLDGDQPFVSPGAPRMLTRAVRALVAAMRDKAQRARDLGPQHPEMKRLTREIEHRREVAKAQLAAEVAFVTAWRDALGALPKKATHEEVYKTRITALRATMAKSPPSTSPAGVRLAFEDVMEAQWAHDLLGDALGPKNPELIAAGARLDAAKATLAQAVAEADAMLAARLAAKVTAAPRGAALTKRAELAEAARDLRREYELLIERR